MALCSTYDLFLQALSFLTLFPTRHKDAPNPACVFFFFPVGLLLGSVLLLATKLLLSLLPARIPPSLSFFLAAWLWIALMVFLTRGLHWDGLGDIGDAVGSGTSGEKFRAILKDSRIGTFGTLTLLLFYAGELLCLSAHFAQGAMMPLLLAPAWARLFPIWLGTVPAASQAGLGLFIYNAIATFPAQRRLAALVFFLLPLLLFVLKGTLLILLLWPLQYAVSRFLSACALRQGGISGDFFGAGIELSELTFLFCTL